VDVFGKRLGLRDYGLDTTKDLGASVGIDNDAVVAFFGPQGAKVGSWSELQRYHKNEAEEEDVTAVPKRQSLKEDEEDLRQRITDLSAEKRFIEREEEDINSVYCNLLCCISEYHKDILAKEEKARLLVMTTTLEQLQAVRGEVLKVMDFLKIVEKD
jgi:hypothetical protein